MAITKRRVVVSLDKDLADALDSCAKTGRQSRSAVYEEILTKGLGGAQMIAVYLNPAIQAATREIKKLISQPGMKESLEGADDETVLMAITKSIKKKSAKRTGMSKEKEDALDRLAVTQILDQLEGRTNRPEDMEDKE